MRATDFLRQVGHPIPPPPQEIPPRRNMCATGLHNSNFPEVVRPVQRLGGGRGCNKFIPVLGGNITKIAFTRDIFDPPPGQMR